MTDDARQDKIRTLLTFLNMESDAELYKKIPLADDDEDGTKFKLYYSLIQLLDMFSSADGANKCDILKDIELINAHFHLTLDSLEYYKGVCEG